MDIKVEDKISPKELTSDIIVKPANVAVSFLAVADIAITALLIGLWIILDFDLNDLSTVLEGIVAVVCIVGIGCAMWSMMYLRKHWNYSFKAHFALEKGDVEIVTARCVKVASATKRRAFEEEVSPDDIHSAFLFENLPYSSKFMSAFRTCHHSTMFPDWNGYPVISGVWENMDCNVAEGDMCYLVRTGTAIHAYKKGEYIIGYDSPLYQYINLSVYSREAGDMR